MAWVKEGDNWVMRPATGTSTSTAPAPLIKLPTWPTTAPKLPTWPIAAPGGGSVGPMPSAPGAGVSAAAPPERSAVMNWVDAAEMNKTRLIVGGVILVGVVVGIAVLAKGGKR
jgi:hypothetical protein